MADETGSDITGGLDSGSLDTAGGALEVEGGDYKDISAETGLLDVTNLSSEDKASLFDKAFDMALSIGGFDKKGNLSESAVVSHMAGMFGGGPLAGIAISGIKDANESQIQNAIEKGNFNERGEMFGKGLMGETTSIAAGPGGQTGQNDTGANSGGENSGNSNNSDNQNDGAVEVGTTQRANSPFSGKSPWELYQESLAKHNNFAISISPSHITFPNPIGLSHPSSTAETMKSDSEFIPVHSNDLASPIAAILKSGQRLFGG